MKKFIILALILTATTAFADGFLQYDASKQTKIQGFAPDGSKSFLTTVNSLTKDLSNWLAVNFYSPVDCKLRVMSSTSKTGTISQTIVGGQRGTTVVKTGYAFYNFSGCTGGDGMGM